MQIHLQNFLTYFDKKVFGVFLEYLKCGGLPIILQIKDKNNYEKIILTMDRSINQDYNGIKVKNIIDFLLEEN